MSERPIIPLRPPAAPPPETFDTFRHVNRGFVLVSETLWYEYHARRQQIQQDWVGAWWGENIDVLSASVVGACAARDELRVWVRAIAKDYPGSYLVPV